MSFYLDDNFDKDHLMIVANGKAAKIIVPSDLVDMTKSNVVFSETAGIGDVTKPEESIDSPEVKEDLCCD